MRGRVSKIDVAELLQGSGLRVTRQRVALAGLLFDGTDKHMTAEQVFDAARKGRLSVSLATVYNTLHQFTKAGLLREVVMDSSRVYFDTNQQDHHHLFNETSGYLADIPASAISIGRLPKLPTGMQLDRVDVIIRVRDKT